MISLYHPQSDAWSNSPQTQGSHQSPEKSPPTWRWVNIIGADARDFLHRVTSVNVRDLAPGRGHAGFLLTPQGRIRAYFTLWAIGSDEFLFELDAGREGRWQTELLTAIDQYTFTEKMTVSPEPRMESGWIFFDSEEELARILEALRIGEAPRFGAGGLPGFHTVPLADGGRLFHHGSRDFGRGWLTVRDQARPVREILDRLQGHGQEVDLGTVEAWRVHSLRPRVDFELTDATVPLEIGLAEGISPGKGCYPGQEVIEKIISLGQPARRLVLIEGDLPAPGRGTAILPAVDEPSAEIGHITSVIQEDNRFIALAVIRKAQARTGTSLRFAGDSGAGKVVKIAPYALDS